MLVEMKIVLNYYTSTKRIRIFKIYREDIYYEFYNI